MSFTNTSSSDFDPSTQEVTFLTREGQNISVPLAYIDEYYHSSFSQTINQGVQLGAVFIMLLIVLVMTPRNRFKLLPTIVNLLALSFTLVRMILLITYYVSDWADIYVVVSGDNSSVTQIDFNASAVATAFSVPITILIEMALIIQAWSMLRLWPLMWKIIVGVISVGLAGTTIGFNLASSINQILFILLDRQQNFAMQYGYVISLTATICWFEFLFISRLIMHMWETRRILPSINGINAMDALVLSNAVLMVIPVLFVAMQFTSVVDFMAFTLAQTSVVLVLPLGSLVANRLSNPAAFQSAPRNLAAPGGVSLSPSEGGGANGGGAVGRGGAGGGGASSLASGRPLLRTSTPGNESVSPLSPIRPTYLGVTSEARFGGERRGSAPDSVYDKELAHIDHLDIELGEWNGGGGGGRGGMGRGGVRVDRTIESSEERVGASGTESS